MQIFCVILVTSSSSESHFRWLRHWHPLFKAIWSNWNVAIMVS